MRQITRIGDLLLCHKLLDVNETSPGLLNRGGMDDPHFFCYSLSKNDSYSPSSRLFVQLDLVIFLSRYISLPSISRNSNVLQHLYGIAMARQIFSVKMVSLDIVFIFR
jgi:hypothetical protein